MNQMTEAIKQILPPILDKYPTYMLITRDAGWNTGMFSIHTKDEYIIVTTNTCEDNIKVLHNDCNITLLHPKADGNYQHNEVFCR